MASRDIDDDGLDDGGTASGGDERRESGRGRCAALGLRGNWAYRTVTWAGSRLGYWSCAIPKQYRWERIDGVRHHHATRVLSSTSTTVERMANGRGLNRQRPIERVLLWSFPA